MTNTNKPFTHLLRVRYAECDAQKIVFNARYADYIDIATTEFTRAIWGDYNDVLETGVDNRVVSMTINWKAPAIFDDVLAIYVEPKKIGNTSYTLGIQFYKYDTEQLLADAEITYVLVNADDYKKTSIPDTLRAQLSNGAVGIISNHAGV